MSDNSINDPTLVQTNTLEIDPPEPRWPATIAICAVGVLYFALPASVSVGPSWLVPLIVVVLTIPTLVAHHRQKYSLNAILGFINSGVMTLFLIWSLALLLHALPHGVETPLNLLRSAAALWVSNVLIFALWYWRLDGGGPNRRDVTAGHSRGAFLFPQMTEEGSNSLIRQDEKQLWSPQFVDYLFVAFNTSTAFSPTDCPVLSRWAKVLTMIQSSISLSVTVLLAARAVNIL